MEEVKLNGIEETNYYRLLSKIIADKNIFPITIEDDNENKNKEFKAGYSYACALIKGNLYHLAISGKVKEYIGKKE